MAFNPFSWFRDHQKGMIIGLIGLAMIVFIGSYGRGDIFDRLLAYVGASRSSGEVVTTLHGKKVREGDITRTTHDRKLASAFLFSTVEKGQREVAKELTEKMKAEAKGSDLKEAPAFVGVPAALQEYQRNWESSQMIAQYGREPKFAGFLQKMRGDLDKSLSETGSRLRRLESAAAKPDLSTDDRLVYQQVATLLGFQQFALNRRSRDDYYFGGGNRPEDVLDFRLWQLQADRLGIKLTDADVMREIVAEAAGGTVLDPTKAFADQPPVAAYLRGLGRDKSNVITPAHLMEALREEFRVVMAQGALLGVEPGARAYRSELTTSTTPALATPDEFLDFYREQRTALRVELFPISAENYLSQIKGEPTEAELLARFERGAKVEPMPYERESGFKRPRRVKVEYVYASPEDAHYKKLAGEQLALLKKLSEPEGRLSSAVLSLLSPGVTAMVPLALDPLGRDFDDAAKEDFGWIGNPKELTTEMDVRRTKRHLTSVVDPASIASVVAGFQGGLVPALAGLDATSTAVEMRRMIPFNLELLLSQSDPLNLFGAAALAAQTMPAATPRSLLEPQILAAKEKSLAEEDLKANYTTMEKELRKLAKKPAEARAYIAKAVQEYKLGIGSMPAARSQQDLLEELKDKKNKLDLGPLRAAFQNLLEMNLPGGAAKLSGENKIRYFVSHLFQDRSAQGGRPGDGGTYVAMSGGTTPDTKQEFLFWRTEDHKAEERTFPHVRDEVVAAWRLDKARAMARARAEKLEAEVNNPERTAADAERFLKEQKLTSFELDNVVQAAPPEREVHARTTTQYRAYQVPEDKTDLLPYPPPDLAKQLMKLTRPGEATVVVDSPAKTFYVALLVDRTVPSLADFKSVYVRSPGDDMMYMALLGRRREEYRKAVVEQLRRDAGAALDKEGRYKLPETLRKGEVGQFEES